MTLFSMVTTERSRDYTPYALRSFLATTPLQLEDHFLLIDNDGTFALPNDLSGSRIVVKCNDEPLSFAENANSAAAIALSLDTDLVFLNNDVIFTSAWYQPFAENSSAVLVPRSNGDTAYSLPINDHGDVFVCSTRMTLSEFTGREGYLEQIAAQHRIHVGARPPFLPVLCAPFFAVRIPDAALRTVGAFDTRFGPGGAEDCDYCVRCNLAGIPVEIAQRSFLLHFGSQSFGPEADAKRALREERFMNEFRNKWGERLTALAFLDELDIAARMGIAPEYIAAGRFRDIILESAGTSPPDPFIALNPPALLHSNEA